MSNVKFLPNVIKYDRYQPEFYEDTKTYISKRTSAKKVLAENLKQKAFKEKAIIDEANKLAKKIEKLEIKVKTKVGPDGKLFGSISNIDISNSLADNKIDLEKDNISIPGRTLKRIGKYEVTVRVHREVSAQLAFEIEPDEESIKLSLIHI